MSTHTIYVDGQVIKLNVLKNDTKKDVCEKLAEAINKNVDIPARAWVDEYDNIRMDTRLPSIIHDVDIKVNFNGGA